MTLLQGVCACPGIAMGSAFFVHSQTPLVSETGGRNPSEEMERFSLARSTAARELEALYEKAVSSVGEEQAQILQAHVTILEDVAFLAPIQQRILEGAAAEYAVQEGCRQVTALFSGVESEYIRERIADVQDVASRLIRLLRPKEPSPAKTARGILAAEDLLPSQTVELDRRNVLGFVTQKGSSLSHTAILARTLGVPAVVGLGDAFSQIREGDFLLLDGARGHVWLNPDEETIARLREQQQKDTLRERQLRQLRNCQSVTRDGREIPIKANIAGEEDLSAALVCGAEGVGLYRSEFLFLSRPSFPTEEEQYEAYRRAALSFPGRQVTIRLLDAGGDKQPEGLRLPEEENPAIGLRAVRVGLQFPQIYRTQLRAIFRAACHGSLAVMAPLVTTLDELLQLKAMAQQVHEELQGEGIPHQSRIPLGIMIETPAAALISDILARHCDFFSIGTNDLSQYTLAADRMNSRLAYLHETLHLSVLRLIALTAENAHREGKRVSVCGEAASNPQLISLLLGLGVDELSVNPPSILPVREALRSLELCAAKKDALRLTSSEPPSNSLVLI